MRSQISKLSVTIFFLLILTACSTKKNTPLRRAFHNVTARYNVLFNAREAYKAGNIAFEAAYTENYNEILPVFKHSQKESLSASTASMERAIAKCSKLIKLHSIKVKPKRQIKDMTPKEKEFYDKHEYNKWVDDAYLLMGKSYFFKDDKYSAMKNFDFVVSENKKSPIRFDAMLWQAMTKVELGQNEDAIEILNKAKAEPDFPIDLEHEFKAIYADIFIHQERYSDAIPLLEEAIKLEKKRKIRVRYVFILAQLQQKAGNGEKAMELYKEVIAMNPPYEMAFSAKIKMATSFQGGNSQDIVKSLKKLLRDEKNVEYRDQIYFAMANIAFQEGRIDEALRLYTQSAALSKTNPFQKAMSYLAMGEIYYDKRDYLKAQPYYDSAVTVLPDTYRNYAELQSKSRNLNDLASEMRTIETQDSLLKMAKMPKRDLELKITDLISKLKAEEEYRVELARIQQQNSQMLSQETQAADVATSENKWYFYNPTVLKFGKTEFTRRWGSRKLEDNWRRLSKEVVAWETEYSTAETAEPDSTAPKRVVDKFNPLFYLQDVPFTDSAAAVSTAKIMESYLMSGIIFMDRIEDQQEAIRLFKELAERFPEYEQMPMVYYFLSILYADLGDEANAQAYRSKVIADYPQSKYAQALINPNYFREVRSQELSIEKAYRKIHRDYFRADYAAVIQSADSVLTAYPNTELRPNLLLLKGLSTGRLADMPILKREMISVKDSFPTTNAGELAGKILEYIGQNNMTELPKSQGGHTAADSTLAQQIKQDEEEREIYAPSDSLPHSLVFVVNSAKIDLNRLKFNLINYNLEYFSNFSFKIEISRFDDLYSMLEVKPLLNATQAYTYFELVNISPEVFEGLDNSEAEFFVISAPNLKVLKADKRVEKYLSFFFENYQR